jgi:hypothetical protein
VTLGSIVAVTEDHCRPTPGLGRAILDAHEREAGAMAIVGAVRNGSRDTSIDWAAFLITQAPNMEPVRPGRRESVGGPIVAYKRRFVDRIVGRGDLGTIELLDSRDLLRSGETFVASDRIVVIHDQSLGLRGTSGIEFHNGRTVAGFRRIRFGRGDAARVMLSPAVFVHRVVRTVRLARSRRVEPRTLELALPAIVWLQLCNSAGELLGYLIGPGDSPRHLN